MNPKNKMLPVDNTASSFIEILSDDDLHEVFKFLDESSLKNSMLVCKK